MRIGTTRLFIKKIVLALIAIAIQCTLILQELHASEGKSLDVVYNQEREKLVLTDLQSREVMARIYEINLRMKSMSRKRDNLVNRLLGVQGNVKSLARSIAELESKITNQREQLRTRLRAIYMLGEEGVARIVFSATNAQELDQSLKYLKIISDNDYKIIKSFEKNLRELTVRRDRLKSEVKSMLAVRDRLRSQEELLNRDQATKAMILTKLKSEKEKVMKNIAEIRSEAEQQNLTDILNMTFYEQKGRLQSPSRGELINDFGMIENEEFKYRLSHKGHRYSTIGNREIRSVFGGTVSFVGEINGYNKTIILDHGDHYYTVYAGANKVFVREGQKVATSDLIAKANTSLYFEIRHFSDAIDPKPWLSKNMSENAQR